ncbi:MAG: TetR/AcrR family transcriptional regulator [Myxococcota bacterium]|nr:TetR/AcrR family transcriptional regulator [Myxococcota bacterium]
MAIKRPGTEKGEGRRERRSRELRERIYRTAGQLFLEHGYEETTIGQIAEAADIAPATFFNHFPNKAAVLTAMTDEVLAYTQALLDEQLERDATTQDKIAGFADRVGEEILEAAKLAHDAMIGLIHRGANLGEVAPHTRKIRDPFAEMLREGQDRGEVRDDLDATFLAEVVIGALNAAISNWLGDADYPLADRLRDTATFMGDAIRPRS